MTALLVVLGALVGAPVRYLVSRRLPGEAGTLAVNVVGSFLLGLLVGSGTEAYALLGIGFCGALTTFSTFALEAVDDVPVRRGAAYVLVTVVTCLAAAGLGLWLR